MCSFESFIIFYIQVTLGCTDEAPKSGTVTVQCNESVVYTNTTQIEYGSHSRNITGMAPVPRYQTCIINITFSNDAGSSAPLLLSFG